MSCDDPCDMGPAFFTSQTFPTTCITNSTGTNPSANKDVFCIKGSDALAYLNKLETQSTNPDIEELANILHSMISLN